MTEEEIPASKETKIPIFLRYLYVLVIVGGILAFFCFWNGSKGWFDRGFWHQLQHAAATKYPFEKNSN